MKRMVNKLHAKSLAAISFILLIATLMSCLLVFPASAIEDASFTWSDSGNIYSTTTDAYPQLGEWETSASYSTSTHKLSWSNSTVGTYTPHHVPSNINYGESKYVVYYLGTEDYNFHPFKDDYTYTVTSDDGNRKYYTITGDAGVRSYFRPSHLDGTPWGRLNFTQTLRSNQYGYAGTTSQNLYFNLNNSYTDIYFTRVDPTR